MAVVLALLSALMYGLSDFVGGLVSRRVSAWPAAAVGQTSSTVCTAAVALFVAGTATGADFAWGALAGLGSGVGTAFLYRGLASGRMGVVAPVSAVGSALVPVAVGSLTGERPGAWMWVGIALALPAIWLISAVPARAGGEPRESFSAGLVDGVVAGLGFGGMFAALGQVPDSAGLWPLATTQGTSVLTVIGLAVLLRVRWVPRNRSTAWAALTGPFGATALLAFLLATQRGLLTLTGVLAAFYPAVTVLLAVLVLREQVHRAQAVGLVLCAASVVLVSVA